MGNKLPCRKEWVNTQYLSWAFRVCGSLVKSQRLPSGQNEYKIINLWVRPIKMIYPQSKSLYTKVWKCHFSSDKRDWKAASSHLCPISNIKFIIIIIIKFKFYYLFYLYLFFNYSYFIYPMQTVKFFAFKTKFVNLNDGINDINIVNSKIILAINFRKVKFGFK